VLKVLSLEQIETRVETFAAFLKMTTDKRRSFLGNIIIMEESALPMATPKQELNPSSGKKKANQAPPRTRSQRA
jgi:hypothetical protein